MSDRLQPFERHVYEMVVRRHAARQGAVDDVVLSEHRVFGIPSIVDRQRPRNSGLDVHLQYVERQPISNASLEFLIHK